jgi:hypothetical protein
MNYKKDELFWEKIILLLFIISFFMVCYEFNFYSIAALIEDKDIQDVK